MRQPDTTVKSSHEERRLASLLYKKGQEIDALNERIEQLQESIDSLNLQHSELNRQKDEQYVTLEQYAHALEAQSGALQAEAARLQDQIRRISISRTYKASLLAYHAAAKLRITGPFRVLLSMKHLGVREAWAQRKIYFADPDKAQPPDPEAERRAAEQRKAERAAEAERREAERRAAEQREAERLAAEKAALEEKEQAEYASVRKHYAYCIDQQWTITSDRLEQLLVSRKYKGIVVYPHAVSWQPMQRPQHFLRCLAEQGYLCLFCDFAANGEGFFEPYPNLIVVYGDEHVLPVLQNRCPIILVSYHMQCAFVELVPNKVLWFDLLDKPEFFSGGTTAFAASIYRRLIGGAELVTYSADNLRRYVADRADALELKNAVFAEDFSFDANDPQPPAEVHLLEQLHNSGRKIIGFYGAINERVDTEALRALLDRTTAELVLIGPVSIDLSALEHERLHLIPAQRYDHLKYFSRYFDVALIPYLINDVTNSISPVKFFEYAVQKLPVLSSDILEMRRYEGGLVKIYHDCDELAAQANALLKTRSKKGREALYALALENTWQRRTAAAMERLLGNAGSLRFLANQSRSYAVNVFTVTFLKYDGTNYFSGGAERYLLDLDEICADMDQTYRIYQYAEYNWVRFYNNIEIIGLPPKENELYFNFGPALIGELDRRFLQEATQNALVNIYSPFYIQSREGVAPSIGISHGISWDNEYIHCRNGEAFWDANRHVIESAAHNTAMISVDTNTCNWFQTIDYDVGRKIRYVPNYVDNEAFRPREQYLDTGDRIVITYPRRLYAPRGLYVVLDIMDDILEEFPNVEFRFVGKGFEEDTKHVEEKIAQWGDRVKWYSLPPERMPEAYLDTDISLIPTMYSEGTSLSCIEAMSSGNAVIATRVGGLTDLVLSGYNGLLVEPYADAIYEAIRELITHPEKLRSMKENARRTAAVFSKEQWKSKWTALLRSTIGEGRCPRTQPQRLMLTLSDAAQMEQPAVIETICEYLADGWFVFVACPDNPLRQKSYKRLQFIAPDEDLYFTPEKTMTGTELL